MKPIDSVPLHRKVLVLFSSLDHVEDAIFADTGYQLFEGRSTEVQPTYWTEMPAAPKRF
jgi:hypothetical protein